jgi:anti-sigma factor RsiW
MRVHIKDRLDEYLAGELGSWELRRFERHVADCSSCACAVADAQRAQAYLRALRPAEGAPQPGPEFYLKVRRSIEEKQQSSGWLATLSAALHTPRLAYPLLFLVMGLAVTVWTTRTGDTADLGVFGIPQPVYTASASGDRDLVMTSLVDTAETEFLLDPEIPYFPETPDE